MIRNVYAHLLNATHIVQLFEMAHGMHTHIYKYEGVGT